MKGILSVGIEIPGESVEYVSFRSDRALFDADVIIFKPTFESYSVYESHAGRPLISEHDSAHLVEDCDHWKSELKLAVEAGKIAYVFLCKPDEVYYDTGQRSFSGTGRSSRTTKHVAPKNSYDSLPVKLEGLTPRGGSEIVSLGDLGGLSQLWHEFGHQSEYEVYFSSVGLTPILGTKNKERVVGALAKAKGGGTLVLLPPIVWDEGAFTYARGENTHWNKEGKAFGGRLTTALLRSAEALQRQGKRSPIPEWATAPGWCTEAELELRAEIESIDAQTLRLGESRRRAEAELEEAGELRWLLFETGKPLERAILKALRLLGFTAEPYKDTESEFDSVFVAPEGRCLGEAEGKESRAINVDKISQLARNLEEDFARDGISEYAKGVLFGNAHRFLPPSERNEFFTEKCRTTANRMKAALIRTPDLSRVTRYLSSHPDIEFARTCRQAIFNAEGEIVSFTPTPS